MLPHLEIHVVPEIKKSNLNNFETHYAWEILVLYNENSIIRFAVTFL